MMKGNVIAELSVVPLGTGSASLSQYVAACMQMLDKMTGIIYQLTPMGTIIEGQLDKVLEVVKTLHEIPFTQGVSRVLTTVKIDDRRDKKLTMKGKIVAVVAKYPKVKAGK